MLSFDEFFEQFQTSGYDLIGTGIDRVVFRDVFDKVVYKVQKDFLSENQVNFIYDTFDRDMCDNQGFDLDTENSQFNQNEFELDSYNQILNLDLKMINFLPKMEQYAEESSVIKAEYCGETAYNIATEHGLSVFNDYEGDSFDKGQRKLYHQAIQAQLDIVGPDYSMAFLAGLVAIDVVSMDEVVRFLEAMKECLEKLECADFLEDVHSNNVTIKDGHIYLIDIGYVD